MSKKPKINKRLDNLFKGLAPEESSAKPKPSQLDSQENAPSLPAEFAPTPTHLKEDASSLPAKPAPTSTHLKEDSHPVPVRRKPSILVASPEPVLIQEDVTATYSVNIQSGYQDWATLRVLDETGQRQWTPDEELLVKQVSDQLSQALENARLFQEAQKFKLGIDRTDNAVFITDPDGVIQYINPGFEKVYGYTNEEALGKTPRIIKSGLIPDEQYKYFWGRLLSGGTVTGEIINKTKDGRLVYIAGTNSPILDENSKILGFLSVHQDISARKKSEEEIKERSESLAVLNEIMSLAGQTLEIHTILKTVLEKILQFTGFDGGLITMFNNSRGKLERAVRIGMPGQSPVDPAEGMEQSLCKHVFDNQRDLVIPNLALGAPVDVSAEVQAGLHGYIGIPLAAKGNMLGTLCMFRYANEDIPEKTISLCKTISVQLGFTIENARLFELSQASEADARKINEELAVLNGLSGELAKLTGISNITESVFKYTSQLMDTREFFICLLDENKQEVHFPLFIANYEKIEMPARKVGNGLTDHLMRTNRALFLPDRIDERTQELGVKINFIAGNEEAKCWMGVPLSIGNRVLGAVVLQSLEKENLYNEHQCDLLVTIAQQAAVAFENARLFQETQERAEELALINNIVSALNGATNLQEALQAVIYQIVQALPVARGAVAMLDDDKKNLNVIADHSKIGEVSSIGLEIPLEGNTATNTIIATRKPFILENTANNPANPPALQAEFRRLGVSYTAIFPIIVNDLVIGTVGVDMRGEDARLTSNQIALLEATLPPISAAISRLRAEEALTRSEADLRTLFSSMEDVVIVVDKDGRYLRIAPTNPSRLVRPPEELVGQLMHDVMPKETADLGVAGIQKTLESSESVQLEYKLLIDNETIWFLANLTKLDENSVFWVARDITERKKDEEAIKRRNEYLAASAEIGKIITSTLDLNTIFARTVNLINERFKFYHAGIFIVEETGFNASLQEATGEAGKAMKVRRHSLQVNDKSIVGKVTMDGQPVIVNDVAADPFHKFNPLLPETRAEAAIPLRIGSRVIGALDIQSKEVNAFTEDDISVIQTLADQVAVAIDNARSFKLSQEAVMEMREIDRIKSQFLANMSHELRTPLNSIIGFSRVIIKGIDGPVTELQQQDLTAIYNSGQHLLGLINDILDLSKIEAGKMELAFDEVNISDITNSVLSSMSGLIKDKPIQMKRIVQPDLPTVRADAIRIRQVMINLLSNAAKFTDEGDIVVEVGLQLGAAGRREVRVSVTDTGPGIALQDQEKLFQPFSQVDDSPTRKTGGTGLGLSICQHIINMHGGKIWVDSAIGRGSTFHFTLPLFRQESASQSGPNKVILTIDDDIQVIGLYERYLHPQGYEVIPLTDPTRAVERVKQVKPFAVTLDIMMPGVDGWQILDELKGDPDTRNVPVIICSIIEDLKKGFNLGATDYLVKPILEEDLVNALDRLNADGSIREVLVIDDNPDDLRLIGKILTDDGRYKAILAEGGRIGWNIISSGKPPHAVVLDLFMPEVDGFKILENMQTSERLRDIPVIVISGMDLTMEQKDQLSEFGQRLLSKGSFNEKELLTSLQRSLERVHK